MGSDKHKKSHDKKEKKSEKSERHHRHSEKSHKKDRKKDRKEDKELPLKSIIDQPISNDDYFAKSQEFRVWLKLQLNLNFEDLSAKEAHKLFETKFVSTYNAGLLTEMYYTGEIPLDLRKIATNSQHRWTFKLSSKDEEQLQLVQMYLIATSVRCNPPGVQLFKLWVNQKGCIKTKSSSSMLNRHFRLHSIVSPFDESSSSSNPSAAIGAGDEESLPLTAENVELVLDEMRPFLKADGGNVQLAEIDGPVVKLELVGACGTCPSSSMTMKMGLERKLKQRIPEIEQVIQTIPSAPPVTQEGVEQVLDGVRPFLSVAGGKINVVSITGVGGLQPCVSLKMEGTASALQSVKVEIMQRIQRHFMQAIKIEWK